MKYFIILIIVFGVTYGCNSTVSKKIDKDLNTKNKNYKTAKDYYSLALKSLDSISIHSDSNDDFASLNALNILSEISGYEGSGEKNYYGTFGFTDEDLEYWKLWFSNNKDSLYYLFEPESPLNSALFINKYQVTKVDTLKSGFVLHSKKNDSLFIILSVRSNITKSCEKIKVGAYYDFNLKVLFPNTSKSTVPIDSILLKEIEIKSEGISINDIYFSENLKGLCYIR